jgi:hypothetical protein
MKLDLSKLKEAAWDFRALLDRKYPREASLAMVGNRYALNNTARQLLHRGVFPPAVAQARRAKLRLLRDVPGQPLGVDGHNVLITVECAWRGLPLVAADDGFLRDVGQVSRAFKPSPITDRVLHLLAEYLTNHEVGPISVFFDAPLSSSGEMAWWTKHIWSDWGLTVEAAAVPVPEGELVDFPGPICTSDTALIDIHPEVVDLAGEFIRQEPAWQPQLILLN